MFRESQESYVPKSDVPETQAEQEEVSSALESSTEYVDLEDVSDLASEDIMILQGRRTSYEQMISHIGHQAAELSGSERDHAQVEIKKLQTKMGKVVQEIARRHLS